MIKGAICKSANFYFVFLTWVPIETPLGQAGIVIHSRNLTNWKGSW